MRSFVGTGEGRTPTKVGAGVAGGDGGKNGKDLAVPDEGAVIGLSWSGETCFGFLVDEENILTRPLRSFQGLPELFLLSMLLGGP